MTTRYVSCSCNRMPHCADWASNGLICFGACNAVAIYEPCTHIGRVVHTLHRHREHVSTVHWIRPRNGAPETELLSCSVDGTLIIWSEDCQSNSFRDTSTLDVGRAITLANSLQLTDHASSTCSRLLVCVGTGNELKVCSRENNANIKVVQTMDFGGKFSLHCRLTHLPNTKHLLMATALENSSVVLCIADELRLNFVKVQSLLGHQDWVKCMDFCHYNNGSIFLATGSEDTTIRLWKINQAVTTPLHDELMQKREIFTIDNVEYNVTLETILYGHESWVYGVHWQPILQEKKYDCQSMRLLSSSFDKSMIIWKLDDCTEMWTEEVRVGEVGGNSLGFYGCKFGPDGLHILGYDYQGSFHIWKYSQEIAKWLPRSAPSGHFSEVVDLCWEPRGRFLLTASTDKTTRVHAPWKNNLEERWHEIARPQVHGHDMSCLVMLAPYMYASGAEEKVVRVFTATSTFRDRLGLLADVEDFKSVAARGATVPSLGLTNKATFDEESAKGGICKSVENPTTKGYETPTEEELMQDTLWPELKKLYGHGYEIFCMAARHDGSLLATACKSTNLEHAAIILWSTTTWSQVQRLVSHQLTVTQMEFSSNDMYLLSVSRDRKWSLYKEHNESYALTATSSKNDSPHSRIIWCCAWTRDSNYFATGSRDGKVGVWSVKTEENDANVTRGATLDTQNQSVTAVCFAPTCTAEGSYVLAVGFEIGHVEIYTLIMNAKVVEWTKLMKYDTSQAHHLTVRKLMFQPSDEQSPDTLRLASCGSDHIVKIRDVDISSRRSFQTISKSP